jgi:uncharacterized protein involved in exopolysaccharide biosynthesis
MAAPTNGLTLKGLARILRDHMTESATQFAEVRSSIQDLRSEIGAVAVLIRDLGQVVARHHDQLAEHQRQREEDRQYIRQILSRMEQHDARMAEHDARFEEMTREIRRILDTIERRGGDGGRRGE